MNELENILKYKQIFEYMHSMMVNFLNNNKEKIISLMKDEIARNRKNVVKGNMGRCDFKPSKILDDHLKKDDFIIKAIKKSILYFEEKENDDIYHELGCDFNYEIKMSIPLSRLK